MLLSISGVHKSYGSKKVLHDVHMHVKKGEIHGLVGKNGAGKSTLVKIISGVVSDYEGDIIFDNVNINHLSVFERQNKGIYVVPQHATVIPEFSVAENIFLGTWPSNKIGKVDWQAIHAKTNAVMQEFDLQFDSRTKAKDLSLVNQRKLNIVRALFSQAKLIILDEPTTSLSAEERSSLFEFVIKHRQRGTSFIFISHYLEEVMNLCQAITVIRDGKSFTGYTKENVSVEKLSNLIVGEEVQLCYRQDQDRPQDEKFILKCDQICGPGMKGISLGLRRGEILGIVGFPGSGSREMCRALAGLNSIESGTIHLNGRVIDPPAHPSDAIWQNIIYVSYDRHKEGIVDLLTIKDNISLSILKTKLRKSFGMIDQGYERKNADRMFSKLNIKAHSIFESVGHLSGGNQQKVVISKALSCHPEILIIDEPTVGIDVQSREEILSLINELTKMKQLSVIYLTNDYNELLRVSDRLLFFSEGRVFREVMNHGLTTEQVIAIRDGKKEGVPV